MTKKDKATAKKTVRLRENVWIREEKEKKIPDENASYGKYAIFMENRPKKKKVYMYT